MHLTRFVDQPGQAHGGVHLSIRNLPPNDNAGIYLDGDRRAFAAGDVGGMGEATTVMPTLQYPTHGHAYHGESESMVHIWLLLVCWFIFVLLAQTLWKQRFEIYGIEVGMLSLKCKTTVMNRTYIRVATLWPKGLRLWFTIGSFVGLIAMVVGPVILGRILYGAVSGSIVPMLNGFREAPPWNVEAPPWDVDNIPRDQREIKKNVYPRPEIVNPLLIRDPSVEHKHRQFQQHHVNATTVQKNQKMKPLSKRRPGTQLRNLRSTSRNDYETPNNADTLMPVIPGVTVPASHLTYIFGTLAINGFLHESGHALAAINGDVRMESFGMLVYLIYPAAFVELNSRQLDFAAAHVRLRIASAGIWHNLLLMGIGMILQANLRLLLSPWYDQGVGGLTVTRVQNGSPLGETIRPGDVITNMDGDCDLNVEASWPQCTARLLRDFGLGINGFCVGDDMMQHARVQSKEIPNDCCDDVPDSEKMNNTATFLCYKQATGNHNAVNVSVCAAAKKVFSTSSQRCRTSTDCGRGQHCLVYYDNGPQDRLLQLRRHRNTPVMFLGDPSELVRDIFVMDYVPIHEHHDRKRPPDTYWPEVAAIALEYFISISAALGVLNIIPAYKMDGQYAVAATIDIVCNLFKFDLTRNTRESIGSAICLVGTLLLLLNMVLAFWRQLPSQSSLQFE